MSNHWHFVVWPERDGDLPAFMQQVTNTQVKRWKEHRHEIGYGHLYQGRYKCFPVKTEDYFLPGRSLRGAERPVCKPRGASGIVALVEFAPCGVRRPGVSHPLEVAFATPHRWLQLVNQPQTEAEVAALRCCVNRGRPFGDPNWVMDPPSDSGWNGRFGPVEDRRNNHRLVTVTCIIWILQIWWLSPFTSRGTERWHDPG